MTTTSTTPVHPKQNMAILAQELCDILNANYGTSVGKTIEVFGAQRKKTISHKNVTDEYRALGNGNTVIRVRVDNFDPFLIQRNANMTKWSIKH